MKLHFGVAPVPYDDGKTTGEVARYLENKYHPMEIFFELHGQQIADDMAVSLAGSLESLMMGAPATLDPFGTAMSKTQHRFQDMLQFGEMEKLGYPGIPTEAAKQRRSLRFKSRKASKPRPSLIDTGLYSASFKAWVEE